MASPFGHTIAQFRRHDDAYANRIIGRPGALCGVPGGIADQLADDVRVQHVTHGQKMSFGAGGGSSIGGNSSSKASRPSNSATSPFWRTGSYDDTVAVTADDGLAARQLELHRDTDGLTPVVAEQTHSAWSRNGVGHNRGPPWHMQRPMPAWTPVQSQLAKASRQATVGQIEPSDRPVSASTARGWEALKRLDRSPARTPTVPAGGGGGKRAGPKSANASTARSSERRRRTRTCQPRSGPRTMKRTRFIASA